MTTTVISVVDADPIGPTDPECDLHAR